MLRKPLMRKRAAGRGSRDLLNKTLFNARVSEHPMMAMRPYPTTFQHGANVHVNQIRLHYLCYGAEDLPPVILVPGITSPAATWSFVGEVLGRTLRTYIVDVRGRGLSQAGPNLDYSLDACVEDIRQLAQKLSLAPYALLGHSMGGRIAIRTAAQDAHVARVAFVDPPLSGPNRRRYPRDLQDYLDAIRLARKGVSASELARFSPTLKDEHLRVRAEWLHTCDEFAVSASYLGFHQDDIHHDLARLTIPALFVVAGKGPLTADEINEVSAILPHTIVRAVAGAGHMIPMDDLAGFIGAIADFFAPAPTSAARLNG
jgi:N-formylmaleamate deformylase